MRLVSHSQDVHIVARFIYSWRLLTLRHRTPHRGSGRLRQPFAVSILALQQAFQGDPAGASTTPVRYREGISPLSVYKRYIAPSAVASL